MGYPMTDAERADAVRQLRAALTPVRAMTRTLTRPQDAALARCTEIQREMEADYAARLRRWEQDAPKRAAAEEAMRLAHERRAAELGTRPGRMPVLASLWAAEPQPLRIW